ncbi:hypothetical protein Pint_31851 [Pistacia integerrima]|uniref:Uncharacterized protein n=1 Tax=Pistacia integerrima TaxID=434235 RepID=A0ACC0XSQ5_9ROSI|nr:hypothetical protein Pint_31851 [Pistacia integerrima]
MLTHPSISRFHLQIHSKPSLQNLSVIDLSSVHGTWVSERKIESCVPVELNEGDTIKIGGQLGSIGCIGCARRRRERRGKSSGNASDYEFKVEKSEPFQIGKSELSGSLVVEPKEEQTCQDEISILVHDKPSQSLDWFLGGLFPCFVMRDRVASETRFHFLGIVPMDLACSAGGEFDRDQYRRGRRENEPPAVRRYATMQEKPSMDKNLNLLSALNSGCSNEEGFLEGRLVEA